MSNNPYNNANKSADNRTDHQSTSGQAEEPSKVTLEHGGEMDAAEYDAMLHDALTERDEINASKQKKLRLVTAACFLTLIGSAYSFNPISTIKMTRQILSTTTSSSPQAAITD